MGRTDVPTAADDEENWCDVEQRQHEIEFVEAHGFDLHLSGSETISALHFLNVYQIGNECAIGGYCQVFGKISADRWKGGWLLSN